MAISQSKILAAKGDYSGRSAPGGTYTAKASGIKTAFLCHSHKDKDMVVALQDFLWKHGWKVYVDWLDSTMPEKPNSETAEKIQKKIQESDWFLFLATHNSTTSRWCPWEIGYGDAVRGKNNIIILPTADSNDSYGNEYLELYRRIDITSSGEIVTYNAGFRYSNSPLSKL